MNFAEHLMALRKQRGWSQEELGNQIGVTRQTVSKWEMGQSTPELEKLVELSRLFGMSIDQLVGLAETGEQDGLWETQQRTLDLRSAGLFYEYISPVKVLGLPLVHIRFGMGPRLAKGIIAIGNCAVGVVAIGGSACGHIAVGKQSATGTYTFVRELGGNMSGAELWDVIKREFPHMWGWVKNVIQWVLR